MSGRQNSSIPALSGRWACLQVTTGEARVARIGRLETATRLLSQLDIVQSQHDLAITWEILDLSVDSGTPLARPRISSAVVRAMGILQRPGRIEGDETSGWRLVLPAAFSTIGARLTSPDEPLPVSASDPRVIDAEDNGRPGATITFSGLLAGRVDVVQRSRSRLEGRAHRSDLVCGAVHWQVEQTVLGATNPLLRLVPKTRPINDPAKSWFRMRRVHDRAERVEVLRTARRLLADGSARQQECGLR